MTLSVITYVVYLTVGIGIILWVSEVLFSNARIFFDDIFHGDQLLSDSTNKLLKMGFYLLNIGAILFLMKTSTIDTSKELFEVLSVKVGTIILIVGVLYLVNVNTFFKLRKKAKASGHLNLSETTKMKLEVIEKEVLE